MQGMSEAKVEKIKEAAQKIAVCVYPSHLTLFIFTDRSGTNIACRGRRLLLELKSRTSGRRLLP
jgi:hypothetical protein